MIQGIVHSLYKESEPPYFDVRQLSTQQIVKCAYPADKDRQVVELPTKKEAVVLVSGLIKARRLDGKAEEVRLERCGALIPLSEQEFLRLRAAREFASKEAPQQR
jgi:hypothetical protein